MQVIKMSNLELLNNLEKYKSKEKEAKEILHEINHRLDLGKLTFKDKENNYLYIYMLLSNKYNELSRINELIDNKSFIALIDKSAINGSTLLSLTDKCHKPRKTLLSCSTTIRDSIINSDELFQTKDILVDLSVEEMQILRSNVEIDNYLVLNGIRFDTLNENTINSLIEDIILFKNYDIYAIRSFANTYSDPKSLAHNKEFLKIYLSKLDDNLTEENKIFKYLTYKEVTDLKITMTDNIMLHLIKDINKEEQKKMLKLKTVTKLLVNCNDINVLNELPKDYLITLLSEKENILSGINLVMLKNLNKQELSKVAKKNKHFYSDLVEQIANNNELDFKPFISALPVELLKDLGNNHLSNFNFDVLKKLLDSNKNFFKESILNNKVVSNYLVNRENVDDVLELLDDADFNNEERIRLLDNCFEITHTKNISSIVYTIPENLRSVVYKNDYLRNCVLNDSTFKLDSYTTKYLLNNPEETLDKPVEVLINLLITADMRFTEDLLSVNEILIKVFKEGAANNPELLASLLKSKPGVLPFYKKDIIKEYYNPSLLTELRKVLDQNEVNNICTDDVINNIYHDKELVNVYKKLLNNNAYLLNTLNFSVLNENTKELKLAILDHITKYPNIQNSIVEINKKYTLKPDFMNQFYFATKDLSIETIEALLEVFKKSVYGDNRKKVGNLVKMITVSSPGCLNKDNFGKLIDYLLFFVPRFDNITKPSIIKTPITLNEVIKYEDEVNKHLTALIAKGENVRENFILKHFKLSIEECLNILNKYSIERIDSTIYKREYNYLKDLETIFNADEELLKAMDFKSKVMTMYDSYIMEEDIKKMYGKIYNFEIRSKTYANRPFIKEIFGKELKIFTCPNDFFFLISNVDIEEEYNKTNSFLLGWHNTINKANGIQASLIANDNLCLNNDITFGFNGVLENGIKDISPYFLKHSKYMTPRELIDNTRDINNHLILDKFAVRPNFNNSNIPNIEPDYILVDMNKLDDKTYLEKISRASQEFKTKRNKDGLPIIAIDKNKIANMELTKVNNILSKYQKNHDMLVLNSIITKLDNNYTAYKNTDKELASKFSNMVLFDTIKERIKNSNSISELEYIEKIFVDEENKYKYIKKNLSTEEFVKELKDKISNRIEELNGR